MKFLERLGAFAFFLFIYYIVALIAFGVNEENILQVPGWFVLVGIAFTFGGTWLFSKLSKSTVKSTVKKKGRSKKALFLVGVIIFFVAFFCFYLFDYNTYPIEDNILQIPDSVLITQLACSLALGCGVPGLYKLFVSISQKKQNKKQQEIIDKRRMVQEPVEAAEKLQPISISSSPIISEKYDELLNQAAIVVLETNQASISMLQRRLNIGFDRAARIIDQLEKIGVIGPFDGSTPRQIIITENEYFGKGQKIIKEQRNNVNVVPVDTPKIDFESFIKDEDEWRKQQSGLSDVEYELHKIDFMEGHDFEYWCADLLKKNGFINVEVTSGSNDQGVDVLAENDGIKYAIQCKCYTSDIGNKPVQEVYAGKEMYDCQVGVVMANRHFTTAAKELAKKTRVLLWDRDKLIEMLRQQNNNAPAR